MQLMLFQASILVALLSFTLVIIYYSVSPTETAWPTQTPARADIVLRLAGNMTQVIENSKVVFGSQDAATSIQKALDRLEPGNLILLEDGRYHVDSTIFFPNESVSMEGQGNDTILDFSKLGSENAIILYDESHLSNLRLEGSTNPLPEDFSQKIIAENNARIDNLSIAHMGYGIETAGKINISLYNISCFDIKSKRGWATCIHAGGPSSEASEAATKNLHISGFNISDSNRGIELDAISDGIVVENGIIRGVIDTNITQSEPFSLDTHSHDGEGSNRNITFRNVIMMDSYGPTVKVASKENLYSPNDMPRDVVYSNITVINPKSSWQINGNNITIQNSIISNMTNIHAFVVYKNTADLLIENSHIEGLDDNHYTITNPESATGIRNLSIINNTIYDRKETPQPFFHLKNVNTLSVLNNTIIKEHPMTGNNENALDLLIENNNNNKIIMSRNTITFLNGTKMSISTTECCVKNNESES
jgi:hypothetical protein